MRSLRLRLAGYLLKMPKLTSVRGISRSSKFRDFMSSQTQGFFGPPGIVGNRWDYHCYPTIHTTIDQHQLLQLKYPPRTYKYLFYSRFTQHSTISAGDGTLCFWSLCMSKNFICFLLSSQFLLDMIYITPLRFRANYLLVLLLRFGHSKSHLQKPST